MGWTEASGGAVEAEGSRASAGSHGGEVGGRWRGYVGGGGSGEGAGCEEKRDVGIGRDAIYGSQGRVMCREGRVIKIGLWRNEKRLCTSLDG